MTAAGGAAVRIGIVGAGFVAGRHVQALERVGGAVVVGVADTDPARAEALAAATGGAAVPDVEALLEDTTPDALIICTPPGERGAAEQLACSSGTPFLVEKPLGADLATAEQVAAAAAASGTLAVVGYHWRFLVGLERARDILRGQSPTLGQALWLDHAPGAGWWPWRSGSGGQVVEQATHVIDALQALVGDVEVLGAAGARREHADGDVFEATAALLASPGGGLVATLAASSLLPDKHRAEVQVTAERTTIELSERELFVVSADGDRWVEPETADPVARQDAAFLAAVEGEVDPRLVGVEAALRSHAIACEVERLAADATGRGATGA